MSTVQGDPDQRCITVVDGKAVDCTCTVDCTVCASPMPKNLVVTLTGVTIAASDGSSTDENIMRKLIEAIASTFGLDLDAPFCVRFEESSGAHCIWECSYFVYDYRKHNLEPISIVTSVPYVIEWLFHEIYIHSSVVLLDNGDATYDVWVSYFVEAVKYDGAGEPHYYEWWIMLARDTVATAPCTLPIVVSNTLVPWEVVLNPDNTYPGSLTGMAYGVGGTASIDEGNRFCPCNKPAAECDSDCEGCTNYIVPITLNDGTYETTVNLCFEFVRFDGCSWRSLRNPNYYGYISVVFLNGVCQWELVVHDRIIGASVLPQANWRWHAAITDCPFVGTYTFDSENSSQGATGSVGTATGLDGPCPTPIDCATLAACISIVIKHVDSGFHFVGAFNESAGTWSANNDYGWTDLSFTCTDDVVTLLATRGGEDWELTTTDGENWTDAGGTHTSALQILYFAECIDRDGDAAGCPECAGSYSVALTGSTASDNTNTVNQVTAGGCDYDNGGGPGDRWVLFYEDTGKRWVVNYTPDGANSFRWASPIMSATECYDDVTNWHIVTNQVDATTPTAAVT